MAYVIRGTGPHHGTLYRSHSDREYGVVTQWTCAPENAARFDTRDKADAVVAIVSRDYGDIGLPAPVVEEAE